LQREAALTQLLCVPPAQYVSNLEKSRADRRLAVKEAADIASELGVAIAHRISADIDAQLERARSAGALSDSVPATVVVAYHRWGAGDYDFLGRIINTLAFRYRNSNHPSYEAGLPSFNCVFYFSCCNDAETAVTINVPGTTVPKAKDKGKGKKGTAKEPVHPLPPSPPAAEVTSSAVAAPVASSANVPVVVAADGGCVVSVCSFDGSGDPASMLLLPHATVPEKYFPVKADGLPGIWMLYQSSAAGNVASLKDAVLALNGGKGGGLSTPTVVKCQGQGTHLERVADIRNLLVESCC
jgi:hypothetical protein